MGVMFGNVDGTARHAVFSFHRASRRAAFVTREITTAIYRLRTRCPVSIYARSKMTPKKTYAEKLKDPRWQKKRLAIFERDNWTCQGCGATDKTLHVHHIFYEDDTEPWDSDDNSLITLCEDCHEEATTILRKGIILKCNYKSNRKVHNLLTDLLMHQWEDANKVRKDTIIDLLCHSVILSIMIELEPENE